jgi:hypothetical protein
MKQAVVKPANIILESQTDLDAEHTDVLYVTPMFDD